MPPRERSTEPSGSHESRSGKTGRSPSLTALIQRLFSGGVTKQVPQEIATPDLPPPQPKVKLEPPQEEIRVQKARIHTPRFISEQVKIEPADATRLARELNLPGVTGKDDAVDAMIGLEFCRGRGIDVKTALRDYREEAKRLPRTPEQLVEYFAHVDKASVQEAATKYAHDRQALDEDLFTLEKDLLGICGIQLPPEVQNLDGYFYWIAGTKVPPYHKTFVPNKEQLDAFRFLFYKRYAWLVSRVDRQYDPTAVWNQMIESYLTENWRQNQSTNDLNWYLKKSLSYYQQYVDHDQTSVHVLPRRANDFQGEELLFHTTSAASALNIIISGRFAVGPFLGGTSFSAGGVSHPRGEISAGEDDNYFVSLMAQYGQVHEATAATVHYEQFREHEREVRSPLPMPVELIIGCVPADRRLFPTVLATGYAGDKSYGGPKIAEWRKNYEERGTVFTDEDRMELKLMARALHLKDESHLFQSQKN